MKTRIVVAATTGFLLSCLNLSAAAISGSFNVAGTVTVTPDLITWTANFTPFPPNQTSIGPGATGDFAPVSGTVATIADLARATQPVGADFGPDPFIHFLTNPTGLPDLNITYIYPGIYSSALCFAATPHVGDTCTLAPPVVTGASPFNFVNNPPPASPQATATWVFQGLTSDGLSGWYGNFTSQFSIPLQSVVAAFGPGGSGSISNTYSGTIYVTALPTNPVPEPGVLALTGSALLLFGFVFRRRIPRSS